MTNHYTFTIGIPAHNEAKNIRQLLNALIMQKVPNGYTLKHIVVLCDGCTDDTAKIVQSILSVDKRIVLSNDGQHLGKSERLSELYKQTTTDILITMDADTLPANDSFLVGLLLPFQDTAVGLVGANDTPAPSQTFVQKVGSAWINAWYEMRHSINNGDIVHNHKGCASAGRSVFLQKVKIPKELHSDDDFVYFRCKQLGYKFVFAESSVIYYTIPSNFGEYISQSARFLTVKHEVGDYLGTWVYKEYAIPSRAKIRGLIVTFIHDPFYFTVALVLQIWIRTIRHAYLHEFSGITWKQITSSKTHI